MPNPDYKYYQVPIGFSKHNGNYYIYAGSVRVGTITSNRFRYPRFSLSFDTGNFFAAGTHNLRKGGAVGRSFRTLKKAKRAAIEYLITVDKRESE